MRTLGFVALVGVIGLLAGCGSSSGGGAPSLHHKDRVQGTWKSDRVEVAEGEKTPPDEDWKNMEFAVTAANPNA
jgi:hypothetical protein